jgi:hypothetical protein
MWTGNPPKSAIILGGMGLIPFVSLALIIVAGPQEFVVGARLALTSYGALILSFLGGVHWGYCIGNSKSEVASNVTRLVVSVIPSLVAWGALVLPIHIGLFGLAGSFLAMLVLDTASVYWGWVPTWYPKLRWPLTICAVTALIAAAL